MATCVCVFVCMCVYALVVLSVIVVWRMMAMINEEEDGGAAEHSLAFLMVKAVHNEV